MQAREIPRQQWTDFFDTFSTQHEDWIASIEIAGERVEARELPLMGVSADRGGSEPNAIEIEIGRDAADRLTHIIEDAEKVLFKQSDDEAQIELEITSADGPDTVVRLRRGTRAEIPKRSRTGRSRKAGG